MKEAVIIEAERAAYSISQIDDTMTVGDLISVLRSYPKDAPIYLSHDNGYTYGPILGMNIDGRYLDDDCDWDEACDEPDWDE